MKQAKTAQSIRGNIRRALLIYTAVVVVLLWIGQIVLLRPFYHLMQHITINAAGEKLLASLAADPEETFSALLEQMCIRHNMSAVVFNSRGVQTKSLDMLGGRSYLTGKHFEEVLKLCEPVLLGEKETVIRELGPEKGATIVFAGRNENADGQPSILLLNAMLSPVESTVGILKQQLQLIIAVLLLLSLAIAHIASERLVRPLRTITDQAKRLAQGDYTADYEGAGITEIEELAETLNFSADGLSHVEELRRELVANVSHDLKTPLTMIIGYAEMIRDLTGDDKQKRDENLSVIIDEAQRLTGLVNDLIAVSRDEAQAAEIHPEPLDLAAMIGELAGRFSATLPDYTVSTDCCENCVITADRSATGQVLYNLISNAVNYTGSDKRVTVRAVPCGADGIRVEVCDTGAGIPAEQLPLIWERYYRSRNTHRRPTAGSGLGLSIVRGALERQGFRYGVESTVGAGSCFWFEAPRAAAPQSAEK